jgi:hypothetical protein
MHQVLKSVNALRRILARQFYKDYPKNKLKKRKGKCKKCGECCRGCFFLDNKTKLCKIYKNRPRFICHKDFPLDKEEQRIWQVEKVCGYKFKD